MHPPSLFVTQRDIDRLREDIDKMHAQNSEMLGYIRDEIRGLAGQTRVDTAAIYASIEEDRRRVSRLEAGAARQVGAADASSSIGRKLATHAGLFVATLGLVATWVALFLTHVV